MANTELRVEPRSVTGKKVKALRRDGITPANVYGHRMESTAVQANTAELTHLLRTMSRNQLVDLKVAGDDDGARTVVIRDVQRNPLNGRLVHVDFFRVSMTEKMRAEVPVVLHGTSPAVSDLQGVLLQTVDMIHVEALPQDIPAQFDVDVGVLTELDQGIHIRDLKIDESKVTVMSDPDIVVARVAAPRLMTEEEEQAAAAEAAEAAVEGEAEEGEAAPAAEGEQPES
jgi:large subunit ribosomal protein L25